ncbi:MAG: MerR family transcriptional regulator [Gemmatimonadales bacterium]
MADTTLTISQLARATGVPAHTLRYYECAGLLPMVERDRSSRHRRYKELHIRWIGFLRRLRSAEMPIRELRAYARLVARGEGSWPDRRLMLARHRERVLERLAELQEHLAVLDQKLLLGCDPRREAARAVQHDTRRAGQAGRKPRRLVHAK